MAEKKKIQKEGLLERLAEETGCIYLSDLRGAIVKKHCCLNLLDIEVSEYPPGVWRDAASYITGKRSDGETPEEAKGRLLEFLKREETIFGKNVNNI